MSASSSKSWRESRDEWIKLAVFPLQRGDMADFRRCIRKAFRCHARAIRARSQP